MPASSRGITLTALRTARVGIAPCSCRSIAISPAELPKPTTSTRRPRHGSPLRYAELCNTSPAYVSRPGQAGSTGCRARPVATTTTAERYVRRPVWVTHVSP